MKKLPIALQLYSLREAAAVNFVGVLETTAELGYDGVEFAGYGGLSSSMLKDTLQQLGLVPVSSHVGYEQLTEAFEEVVSYNLAIGNTTIVCPAAPREFVETEEGWKRFATEMTALGKKFADQGLRLGYHNHSFEFAEFDGKYALDIFFNESDPAYVFAQIDLGWVLHAGVDPAAYLRQFKGRCPLVHVKDFDGSNQQVDVGCGCLDLEDVLQACSETGVECLIIETEVYAESPVSSVRNGLLNLKAARDSLT
jgi:sugar phosphate isomerase/epimerase